MQKHGFSFSTLGKQSPSTRLISASTLSKDTTLNHWEWDIKRDLIEATDYSNNLFPSGKGQFFGPSSNFIERIHPEDRVRFYEQLQQASQGKASGNWVFRLRTGNQLISMLLDTQLLSDDQGQPLRLVGILRNIETLNERDSRLNQQQDCLQQWACSPLIAEGQWQPGLKFLCAAIAELTKLDYVSVWWFSKSYDQLDCLEQYSQMLGTFSSQTQTQTTSIQQKQAREYFQQLIHKQSLLCNNIDERASLFPLQSLYLNERGIHAKLDTLIFHQGRAAGVLSLEHRGPYHWQAEDQALANAAAGMITQLKLIHEQKCMQQEFKNDYQHYQDFFNKTHEGLCRIEFTPPIDTRLPSQQQLALILNNARLAEVNPAALRMFNVSTDSLEATPLEYLWQSSSLQDALNEWLICGYQQSNLETLRQGQHGEHQWVSATLTGQINQHKLTHLWASLHDITQQKKHLHTISYQAEHDSLTHLPNRFWLMDRLREQIDSKDHLGGTLALMLLDLDHFKEINDSLGHQTGDLLLLQIGPRLSTIMQEERGELVRLGGDEFAMLFTDMSPEFAESLAGRISQCLKLPFHLHGIKLEVNASIGIAMYPFHSQEPSGLLRCADVAMYQAKKRTRPFAFYNSELDEHSPRRLTLMTELGQAIRENQLRLHYQPQLDIKQRSISGFEALVRWQHPSQGTIYPNQFIHLAEMGDLIRPLTLWVINEALAQWCRWQRQGYQFIMAVNLSTRALLDDNTPMDIINLLKKHQVPAEFLELEITESALIADPQRALQSLQSLHRAGIKLSIDDFGTGYSSLAYLKELPINCLKIDMSFVRNMTRDQRDEMIVSSTINLAHNLGLTVVAEGVEDQATLLLLESLGCDLIQGYHLSKPKSADTVALRYADTGASQLEQSSQLSGFDLLQPKIG